MKASTIIILCCILILTGCYFIPTPDPEPSEPEETSFEDTLPEIHWTNYENQELGLSFQYPNVLTVQTSTELEGFDIGKKLEIGTPSFTIVATSSDFAPGVAEGCCFYFAGDPLDLTLSDEEIVTQIEGQFGEISDFQRTEVSLLPAVFFTRTNEYAASWEVDTLLLPYEKYGYTNLMISGPDLDADAEEKEFFEEILASLHFL